MNPIQKLPSKIRVGAFDFVIEKWSEHQAASKSRYGEFSSMDQRIGIQLTFPSPAKAVDTFIHEIMHAIYWAYGIEDDDKEERTVSMLSSGWVQVYRDNPWLADWIRTTLA